MNATGKKIRKSTGHNRLVLHFNNHTHKSAEKRKAMGWGKKGNWPKKD